MSEINDNVPAELRALDQWVGWRWEEREGKRTKPPYIPDGSRKASCDDPSTWASFEAVCGGVDTGELDGIGFQVKEGDRYVGIDLDHCRDPETHTIEPWAQDLIESYNSYTEVSPSGAGIRIFIKGEKPGKRCRQGRVEIYNRDRYLTVTGQHLMETPKTIEVRQAELEDHYHSLWPDKPDKVVSNGVMSRPSDGLLTAYDVVEKARSAVNGSKFDQLMRGDLSEFDGDESRADAALLAMIIFYTQDRGVIEQVFGMSQLATREKWNRTDYRERSIDFAINKRRGTYRGAGETRGRTHTNQERAGRDLDNFSYTDLGNSERLVEWYGQILRHVPALGWVVWNGKAWERSDKRAVEVAKKAVRRIYQSANDHSDGAKRTNLAKHAIASESRGHISAMLELAESHEKIRAEVGDFDRDPMVLNVRNGTIDLRTGELRKHRREDMLTKIIDLDYAPDVPCDLWTEFLEKATKGHDGLAEFLRRAAGYTLTGLTNEDALFLPHGPGGTGKTTFVETLRTALGPYAGNVRIEVLTTGGRSSGGHNEDIARLVGLRMVCAVEASENERLREGQVKHMTGGDSIPASLKHKPAFDFIPVFKLWLATNEVPYVRPEDTGMWRRVHKVPFENTHPKSDLKTELRKPHNLAGILAWAVKGCLEWQQEGLQVPACVEASTAQLRSRMDGGFGQFLEEHCRLDSDEDWTPTRDIRARYTKWAQQMRIPEARRVTDKKLGMVLRERGCEPEKRRQLGPDTDPMNGWWGIFVLDCSTCSTCSTCSHFSRSNGIREEKVGSANTSRTPSTDGVSRPLALFPALCSLDPSASVPSCATHLRALDGMGRCLVSGESVLKRSED